MNKEYKILTNKRKALKDFTAEHHCWFCDPHNNKFQSKLIVLQRFCVPICITCAYNMFITMSKSVYDDCAGENNDN